MAKKKDVISTTSQALTYFEQVIKWERWKDHHSKLVQAILVILTATKNNTEQGGLPCREENINET